MTIPVFPFLKPRVYDEAMYLIVGLGNPGARYAHNRHNIGFMIVDALADKLAPVSFQKKFSGQYAQVRYNDTPLVLLKPETFMNESGRSVRAAATFFKIDPARIIVVHDELDLKVGDIRSKIGGGHAGHNGLKSIQAHLGTADFHRVRVGIDHPGDKAQVSAYVLSDFAKSEQQPVEDAIKKAVEVTLGLI